MQIRWPPRRRLARDSRSQADSQSLVARSAFVLGRLPWAELTSLAGRRAGAAWPHVLDTMPTILYKGNVPAPTPERNRDVYFVGAGLTKAIGLPNTAELITGVLGLAGRWKRWRELRPRLNDAFEYFYPDARNRGYRPDVVDFFSVLRTYIDVGAGLPGGFRDAPDLFRSLKFAIAHLLVLKTREVDARLGDGHAYLDRIVQPGTIAVTSNWDLVLERYAALTGVPVRLRGYDPGEFVLLKLHGSIDWCAAGRRSGRYTDSSYASLRERLFGDAPYKMRVPRARNEIIRIRALESWDRAWSRISSRAADLHMVTMARGKAGDLGPLEEIWRDAYHALSRAKRLEIAGYSLPDDDIEIRTLLRAAFQRGEGPDTLVTRNPSPDVHERVWRLISRDATPNYHAIPPL